MTVKIAVGLTGSIGSGCTTAAKMLSIEGYNHFSLAKAIKKVWQEDNLDKKIEEAPRKELQRIGNELRKSKGREFLAKVCLEEANAVDNEKAVFSGIRNLGEVDYFKRQIANFVLISLYADFRTRFERFKIKGGYNNESVFKQDDDRDQNEDKPEGQQVQLCVDMADIAIVNDEQQPIEDAIFKTLRAKIVPRLNIMIGQAEPQEPSDKEILMALAYTQSTKSKCIKRAVGAVVADEEWQLVSIGFNENPQPILPCVEQFKYCYKDSYIQEYFNRLEGNECVKCKTKLPQLKRPYVCPSCQISLQDIFFPDRAMSRCTAIHAEHRALLHVRNKEINNGIIVTTTFPCFKCAQEIIYSGIHTVIYAEPYPDADSYKILKTDAVNIKCEPFEGIKVISLLKLSSLYREYLKKHEF